MEQLTAIAPAKLILSGEHAVVYGQPALAMAIQRYTSVTTFWNQQKPILSFKFLDLKYAKTHTLQTLEKLKFHLQNDYSSFLLGEISLREVLKRPFELLLYSVGNLIEKLNFQLPRGVEININSDIPMGCGMGSSAAAIIGVLHALINLFKLDVDPKRFLKLALDAENLQHGNSSGLDLHLAAFGGCLWYENKRSVRRKSFQLPINIINTGAPGATTGECVSKVEGVITRGNILSEFGGVTKEMDSALQVNDLAALQYTVKKNHELLRHIGVVPAKVAEFVAEIEAKGGAAKICGAGSVKGDDAGIVMVVGEDDFSAVTQKYDYQLQAVKADSYGTRII